MTELGQESVERSFRMSAVEAKEAIGFRGGGYVRKCCFKLGGGGRRRGRARRRARTDRR